MPPLPEVSGPTWTGRRLCPSCNGSGLITDDGGRQHWCPTCHGAGLTKQPGGT